jgi:hypothetical protein
MLSLGTIEFLSEGEKRRSASLACCALFRRQPHEYPLLSEPSVTVSSTTGMERFLCMPRWTPRPAACTEEPRPATPAVTSLPSSKKWCRCARPGSRFISSSTTSPPTEPNSFETSCNSIRACSFTSPLPTPLGSTKSRSGSPRSNARHCPRHLHLSSRLGSQTLPLHQRLLRQRSPHPVEIF